MRIGWLTKVQLEHGKALTVNLHSNICFNCFCYNFVKHGMFSRVSLKEGSHQENDRYCSKLQYKYQNKYNGQCFHK